MLTPANHYVIDPDFRQSLRIWMGSVTVAILVISAGVRFATDEPLVAALNLGWALGLAVLVALVRWRDAGERAGLAMVMLSMAVSAFKVELIGLLGMAWVFPVLVGSFAVITRVRAAVVSAAGLVAACFLTGSIDELDARWSFFIAGVAVGVVAWISVAHVEELSRSLSRLARVDPLTGAANRRALGEWFEQQAALGGGVLAVIDLDHFKRVNDEHGHAVGDRVLVETAQLVSALAQPGGRLFRTGGEEFVLALPGADRETATGLAQLIVSAVAQKVRVRNAPVTVSIGLAVRHGAEHGDAWMKRADAALYRAKAEGRNRVVDADAPPG